MQNIIPSRQSGEISKPRILVTGATGFLGGNLVKKLVEMKYRVRAFVRATSNIEKLLKYNIEIYYGDIGSKETLEAAFSDIEYVVHAAADTSGENAGEDVVTTQGVRNIVELCKEFEVSRLIYISSCNVYNVAGYKKGTMIDEKASLEPFPEKRGPYTNTKMIAESIVTDAMKEWGLPAVCLRPGTYYGLGGSIYSPMIGLSLRNYVFMIIGNGKLTLPIVYIENVVDAIITAMQNDNSTGKIYNIVDYDAITKKQYINNFLKKVFPRSLFIYIPYSIFYSIVFIQEILFNLIKIKPFLTRYRIISSQNQVTYDASKIRNELGWKPPYTFQQASKKIIDGMKYNMSSEQGKL